MKNNISMYSYPSSHKLTLTQTVCQVADGKCLHGNCTKPWYSRGPKGLLLLFLVAFGFTSKAEQESNLEKAIRYSKNHNEKDKNAYEAYLRLYYFRLANGTSQSTATDLYKSIESCFLGQYESEDITHFCSSLAVDAQAKKFDLKELQRN